MGALSVTRNLGPCGCCVTSVIDLTPEPPPCDGWDNFNTLGMFRIGPVDSYTGPCGRLSPADILTQWVVRGCQDDCSWGTFAGRLRRPNGQTASGRIKLTPLVAGPWIFSVGWKYDNATEAVLADPEASGEDKTAAVAAWRAGRGPNPVAELRIGLSNGDAVAWRREDGDGSVGQHLRLWYYFADGRKQVGYKWPTTGPTAEFETRSVTMALSPSLSGGYAVAGTGGAVHGMPLAPPQAGAVAVYPVGIDWLLQDMNGGTFADLCAYAGRCESTPLPGADDVLLEFPACDAGPVPKVLYATLQISINYGAWSTVSSGVLRWQPYGSGGTTTPGGRDLWYGQIDPGGGRKIWHVWFWGNPPYPYIDWWIEGHGAYSVNPALGIFSTAGSCNDPAFAAANVTENYNQFSGEEGVDPTGTGIYTGGSPFVLRVRVDV